MVANKTAGIARRRPGRGNVTLRMRDELRAALQKKAEASGHSLSEVVEGLLERSQLDQQYAIGALDLVYGPRLTDVLLALGGVMKRVAEYQPFYKYVALRTDWLDYPWKFDEVVRAAQVFLERLRPPGDVVPPVEAHLTFGGVWPSGTPEQKAAAREAVRRAAEAEAAELPYIGAVIAEREIQRIAARREDGGIAMRDGRIVERLARRRAGEGAE